MPFCPAVTVLLSGARAALVPMPSIRGARASLIPSGPREGTAGDTV